MTRDEELLLIEDGKRFRTLYDEFGELVWYPPGWNGNPKARFDLLWECPQSDLRKAIDIVRRTGEFPNYEDAEWHLTCTP